MMIRLRDEYGNRHFIDEDWYKENEEKLQRLLDRVHDKLDNRANFNGIELTDVGCNEIQVNALNKKIARYFMYSVDLKRDFSNVEDVINEIVDKWEETDNETVIRKKRSFIEEGEMYGWD